MQYLVHKLHWPFKPTSLSWHEGHNKAVRAIAIGQDAEALPLLRALVLDYPHQLKAWLQLMASSLRLGLLHRCDLAASFMDDFRLCIHGCLCEVCRGLCRERGQHAQSRALLLEASDAINSALQEAPTNESVLKSLREFVQHAGYSFVHAGSYRYLPGLLGPRGEDPGY